jgi:antitoxin YefM
MRQRAAVVMRENGDPVVLLSLAEYESSPETLHLLRDPINAERLLRSIEETEAGKLVEHDVDEPPGQCHL